MRNATRRIGFAVAVLGLVAGAAGQARAGLVINNAYANTPNFFGGISTGPQTGTNYAQSDASTDANNDFAFVRSVSHAEAGAPTGYGATTESLLRFAASVEMYKRGGVGGIFEGIAAEASWTDRFSLSTSVTASPFDLVFQFVTKGVMSIVEAYSLSFNLQTGIAADGSPSASRISGFGYGYAVGKDELISGGFDSIKFVTTNVVDAIGYEGLVNLRLHFDGSNGTIAGGLSLGISASVEAVDGDAFDGVGAKTYIDSSHSSGLQSVLVASPTLGLVTPESLGWSLSFDSGLASPNIQAVPEPSTFISGGIACVMGLGYGWRRRRMARLAD